MKEIQTVSILNVIFTFQIFAWYETSIYYTDTFLTSVFLFEYRIYFWNESLTFFSLILTELELMPKKNYPSRHAYCETTSV